MLLRVEAVIQAQGPCDVDDVAEHLPECDREQIIRAMLSLRKTGRLVITERGVSLGWRNGTAPSVYDVPRNKQ